MSRSPSHWTRVGTLVSFLQFPELDRDGDGVADEDDWDDDNDGIADADELTGMAFTPRTASDPFRSDSDADGATDGEEAVAGTNPADAASVFRITSVRQKDAAVVIAWQGREGASYDVAVAESPNVAEFHAVTNVLATGGTGAWYEVGVSVTNIPSSLHIFYRIYIHEQSGD